MGLFSKSAYELNAEGLNSLGRGDFEQAVILFDKACRKEPSLGVFWFNLGYAQVKRGDLQRAAAAFERSVSLGGETASQAADWLNAIYNPPEPTFDWGNALGNAGQIVVGLARIFGGG